MTLLDLEEYIATKEKMLADYQDRDAWLDKVIVNIAKASFFSSDRTIQQYNDEIWHLERYRGFSALVDRSISLLP